MPKKQLTGTVISNKNSKTVTVRVERVKEHSKYKRRFRFHKKYRAHTDQEHQIGEKVVIEECSPISKDKKWKVIKTLSPKP